MKNGKKHKDPEALLVYERMIEILFYSKPVEDLKKIIHKDFMGYGTAAHEFLVSIKDLIKVTQTQSNQLQNHPIQISRKPILNKFLQDGESYLIVEEFLFYDKDNDYRYTARLTAILEKIGNKWLVTHFHGSTPDTNIAEEEALPMEGLRRKNLELEAKIKERTWELEIEAALERVRSAAMAMHQSDDLRFSLTKLFEELDKLNLGMIRCGIAILDPSQPRAEVWIMAKTGKNRAIQLSGDEPLDTNFILLDAYNAWKKGKDYEYLLEGEKLSEYYHSLDQIKFQSYLSDNYSKKVKSKRQHYYNAAFKHGSLFAFFEDQMPDGGKTILKRFSNVLNLAYSRFRDIQIAEGQAREALIEASLERVRSRAMAMQHSVELSSLISVVYAELTRLDVSFDRCFIMLFDPTTGGATWWMASPEAPELSRGFKLPFHQHAPHLAYLQGWKERKEKWEYVAEGKEKQKWDDFIFSETELASLPEAAKSYMKSVQRVFLSGSFNSFGCLTIGSNEPLSQEAFSILIRFSRVFDICYTRFNDLKQAEAQARESQIQLALERVRARTMAMQHSDELMETSELMFEQVKNLGIELWSCGFSLWHDDDSYFLGYNPGPHGKLGNPLKIPLTEDIFFTTIRDAKRRGDDFLVFESEGESLSETYRYMDGLPVVGETMRGIVEAGFPLPTFQVTHCGFFSNGHLMFITKEPNSEAVDIFKRFTKVFNQTYTRFLDLQKAEAQAREAKIEAALEKVRAKAMAMHKSEELKEIVKVVFDTLIELGLNIRDGAVGILVFEKGSRDHIQWIVSPEQVFPTPFKIEYCYHSLVVDIINAWENKSAGYQKIYPFEEKRAFFEYLFENNVNYKALPVEVKTLLLESKEYGISVAFGTNSAISVATNLGKLLTQQEFDILKRFAGVFEQAYTRFLDLQKAEAQAREAQIEVALERVRASTMAMHKSEDLLNIITVVSEQLNHLNYKFNTVSFAVPNQVNDYKFWFAVLGDPNPIYIQVPYIQNPMFDRMKKVLAEGSEFYTDTLTPEDSRAWHEHVFAHSHIPEMSEDTKAYILRSGYARSIAIMPKIMLIVSNYAGKPYLEAENEIIKRFAAVFEQSYTRFLDLQKAEAQTREAQIEAALERVRSSAMAMQTSDDLNILIGKVFTECTRLDIQLDRGIIMIFDPKSLDSTWWMANPEAPGLPRCFKLNYHEYPPYLAIIQAWKERHKKWVYDLEGELKKNWDAYIFKETELAQLPIEVKKIMMGFQKVFLNCSFNNFGCLTLATLEPMTESNFKILLRFAKVFDLTYTRFNDLKLAEEQAREAQIETALERIRAKALAMHKSDEFMEVALTLREQMGLLGQKELEASVIQFYNLKKEIIYSWHVMSTPGIDKGNMSAGSFEIKKNTCRLTQLYFNEFQSGKTEYSIVAEGEVLWEWLEYLRSISPEINETIDGLEYTPERAYFYFSKFSEGALLMVSSIPATNESRYLQRRAAQVFELAYKRYKDLKQAEKLARKASRDFVRLKEEKKRTDEALRELTATQAQLIHAEKMASLGQLTAGIAHEIQNPLNFVNNFSEVSAELIEEIEEERVKEIEARDEVLMNEILGDIKENLHKINHHGKRADAIVKGMLEHSRSNSGEKLLTDINTLAEEYLRLSYHGMRAKDKDFQAHFETYFDPNLPKIKVVPQDIGRVLLNIINNAFQACGTTRLPYGGEAEIPTVSVKTRAIKSPPDRSDLQPGDTLPNGQVRVQISVQDNGPGIPDAIKEKIFQPFFTTKPTGQGTGLGLSLSYDIVKAHGGELKVKTKLNEGSEFIIML